jgi:sugar lactone lactonase YvrE
MMLAGKHVRGNEMKSRGQWGVRCRRAVGPAVLLVSLALPQVSFQAPVAVQAATPVPGRPNLATYAGAPAAGKPTDVAQQPFGLAVFGRYTFLADPINHVVRLLIDNSEVVFAGNGSLAVAGDGDDPAKSQLAGPYAVAIGHITQVGYQVTAFDVYIADTFAHQVRKASVKVPPIDSPSGNQTATISTIAGTGSFGLAGDGAAAGAAQLNSPYGVAWDDQRSVIYVADTLNNRVRSINSAGTIATLIATPLNHPRGLAVDGDSLYIADTYNNVVRRYDLGTGALSTVAGNGTPGYLDAVAGGVAQLRLPSGVAVDDKHNLFIADTGNNVVRELSASDKVLRTVAGSGKAGKFGDGGPAMLAQLSAPMGVAVRPNGDVVIADTGNNLVRVLEGTLSAGPAHKIHAEAGNGTPSFAGDGQAPIRAQFAGPASVVSQLGNDGPPNASVAAVTGRRFVVDTFNQAVRTFTTADRDPSNHSDEVGTFAGLGGVRGSADASNASPADSRLAYPMGSAIDIPRNRLYVADTFNSVIRAIDLNTRAVTTVAGTAGKSGFSGDNGAATSATLSYPTGLAVDAAGNLFIADTYNGRIREVVAPVGVATSGSSRASKIFTVAGNGRLGFSGENGDARAADLYLPYGVTLDTAAPPNLYITDSFNHRIRRVDAVGTTTASRNLIHTVAGDGAPAFGDGLAGQAHFNRPWSAAVDQSRLIVADYLNHRLRQIDLGGQAVATLGGLTTSGLKGDAGPADLAETDGPRGLSMLGDSGALLVADSLNNRVRWIGVTHAGIQRTQVNFDPTNLAGQSQPQSVTVSSTGSGLLVMGAVDLQADRNNFFLDPLKNGCGNARIEPGLNCSFDVAFQPRSPGGHNGSVVIPNDATGGPQLVALSGTATAALVTISPPAVLINQPVNGPPTTGVVTLTNNGDGLLNIESIALEAGSDPAFSQSHNCPSVMTAHGTCQITIGLSQIAATDMRARTGRLVIKDDVAGTTGGATQYIPLTGSLAQAVASLVPQTLTFTQNIGHNSPPEALVLRNTGQAPLHLSAIQDAGDFVQTNNCPQTLNPGASCVISVTFVPTNTGERSGYIVIADDSVDSPQKIPVLGVATMAISRLGPDRLSFSQNVGATTSPQTVTLANRGDGPLTIAGISATGDFKASPHCPSVLPPGISCSISVTFSPQAPGVRKGSLVVTNDANAAPGSVDTVRLSGFGYQPVASLSAGTLAPGANLGGSAVAQPVTVTNTGDGVLTIRAIGISGAAAGDYNQSNNCLRALAPGSACSVTVRFTPHGYGVRNATLTLLDDGQGGAQSIALRGSGTSPRPLLSSGFVNFGGAGVGGATVPHSVVLFNAGNGPLSIGSIDVTGSDFALTTNCGSSLQAGASCMISVTFLPQATGARSGIVTITDNAGTQRFTLSGVGT